MLRATSADIARGKQQSAAQVVNLRELARLVLRRRQRQRRVECGEPGSNITRQAMDRSNADPRRAFLPVVARELTRPLECRKRLRSTAELALQFAFEHRQCVPDRRRRRKADTAFHKRDRGVDPERSGLRACGVEIGFRGIGILGAVEMLGAKCRIARPIPTRGGAMQLSARAVQQRRIGAVANQRVCEHQLIAARAFDAHEIALDRRDNGVFGIANQMT